MCAGCCSGARRSAPLRSLRIDSAERGDDDDGCEDRCEHLPSLCGRWPPEIKHSGIPVATLGPHKSFGSRGARSVTCVSEASCVTAIVLRRVRAAPDRRARVGRGHEPAGAARHRPRARGASRGGRLERARRARRSSARRSRGRADARCSPARTTPTATTRDRALADWLQRARRAPGGARRLHGAAGPGLPRPLPGRRHQRAPLAAAGVPGLRRDRAGARLRREGVRGDRPLRRRRRGHGPGDPAARRRAARRARAGGGAARRCARSSTRCCREAVRLFARGRARRRPGQSAAHRDPRPAAG